MNLLIGVGIGVASFFGIYYIGYKDGQDNIIFNRFIKAGKKIVSWIDKPNKEEKKMEIKEVKQQKVERTEDDDWEDLSIFQDDNW